MSFLLSVMLLITAVIWSCSDDSPTSDKSDDSDTGIETGTAKTYEVNSSTPHDVQDTESGLTFSFPDGGNGTLSVAPVTSSPEVGIKATKVAVSYSGDEDVEILVPKTEGGEDMVMVYTRRTGVMVDDFDGDYSWWGIPSSGERDNSVVFQLSPAMDYSKTAKITSANAKESIVLAIASFSPGSDTAQRTAALRASVAQCVTWWIDNLPDDLSSNVQTQVEGDMKYDVTFTSSGSAYNHNGSTFGANAIIELCISESTEKAATIHTVAHEVGHYMNHLLVGTARYEEILNRMPTNWYGGILAHDWGDYKAPRMYITEEYAFLSDALINGDVEGKVITDPMMSYVFEGKSPDERDFPSHEGFGMYMFGALLRTDSIVKSHWKASPRVSAPVVGAPVEDVLALTGSGARDINELRTAIQEYLDTRTADRYKLPAMLEPLGWSYNGMGTVKDTQGNPVKGAIVSSICQDGENEYRASYSTPTLASGEFTLPRIYPGTNNLRIYWNDWADSTDVAFTADWSKPTNETLSMGTFTIDTSKPVTITKSVTSNWAKLIEFGFEKIAEVTPTVTFTATGIGLIEGENNNQILAPVGTQVSAQITATFSVRTIASTSESGKFNFQFNEPYLYRDFYDKFQTNHSNVALTDESTTNTIACTFTLNDENAHVYISTMFGFWFPVTNTDGEVIYEEWGDSWYGTGFSIRAIK